MWPPTSGTAINEFNTEGYISCAFPTLFPTGAADLVAVRTHKVTVGNYFKHLMMYEDGRFARHPRFRYFALNTEMRWCALQTGRIYVRQHPHDAQLSVEELRDMVGREGEAFSNCVLHFATSLRGTRQYWFKQRGHLISMVETCNATELGRLICPEDPDSSACRIKAANNNPAMADWFFCHKCRCLWKHSTLVCSMLLTTGCDLSGSIEAVHMCMEWHGYYMLLLLSSF